MERRGSGAAERRSGGAAERRRIVCRFLPPWVWKSVACTRAQPHSALRNIRRHGKSTSSSSPQQHMTSKMRYFVAGGTAVLVTVSTSLLMAMGIRSLVFFLLWKLEYLIHDTQQMEAGSSNSACLGPVFDY